MSFTGSYTEDELIFQLSLLSAPRQRPGGKENDFNTKNLERFP